MPVEYKIIGTTCSKPHTIIAIDEYERVYGELRALRALARKVIELFDEHGYSVYEALVDEAREALEEQ